MPVQSSATPFRPGSSPAEAGGPAPELAQSGCVRIEVAQTGERFDCGLQESLLAGMLRLGRRGIPAGCANGGCGVCKVLILEGKVRPLGPVSAAHVSAEEQIRGYTLACRVAPLEAVRLQVCRMLRKSFSLRKGSGDA